jgi:hypothetical protein
LRVGYESETHGMQLNGKNESWEGRELRHFSKSEGRDIAQVSVAGLFEHAYLNKKSVLLPFQLGGQLCRNSGACRLFYLCDSSLSYKFSRVGFVDLYVSVTKLTLVLRRKWK